MSRVTLHAVYKHTEPRKEGCSELGRLSLDGVDNDAGVRRHVLWPNTSNFLLEGWSAKVLQFGRFRAANRFSVVPCQPVDDAVFVDFIGQYNCSEAGSSVSHDYLTAIASARPCLPTLVRQILGN
jgi:hypothetical protein